MVSVLLCLPLSYSFVDFLFVCSSLSVLLFCRDECLSTSSEQGLVSQSLLSFVGSLLNEYDSWIMNREERGKRRRCKLHLPLTLFFFHTQSMHMIKGRHTDLTLLMMNLNPRETKGCNLLQPSLVLRRDQTSFPPSLSVSVSLFSLTTKNDSWKERIIRETGKEQVPALVCCVSFHLTSCASRLKRKREKKTKWWEEKQRESKKRKVYRKQVVLLIVLSFTQLFSLRFGFLHVHRLRLPLLWFMSSSSLSFQTEPSFYSSVLRDHHPSCLSVFFLSFPFGPFPLYSLLSRIF